MKSLTFQRSYGIGKNNLDLGTAAGDFQMFKFQDSFFPPSNAAVSVLWFFWIRDDD